MTCEAVEGIICNDSYIWHHTLSHIDFTVYNMSSMKYIVMYYMVVSFDSSLPFPYSHDMSVLLNYRSFPYLAVLI